MKGRNSFPSMQPKSEFSGSDELSGLSQVCTDVSEIRGWAR